LSAEEAGPSDQDPTAAQAVTVVRLVVAFLPQSAYQNLNVAPNPSVCQDLIVDFYQNAYLPRSS
jgi:hypothetical protein